MSENDVAIVVEGAEVTLTVRLPSSANIYQLKGKIKEITGITMNRQTIWLSGQKLEDTMSVDRITNDIGIVRLRVSPLARGAFKVYIKPQSTTEFTEDLASATLSELTLEFPKEGQQLLVKESDSVLELKKKIVAMLKKKMRREGIEGSFKNQNITLYRLGWNMQDDHILSQYYIHCPCTIYFYAKPTPI